MLSLCVCISNWIESNFGRMLWRFFIHYTAFLVLSHTHLRFRFIFIFMFAWLFHVDLKCSSQLKIDAVTIHIMNRSSIFLFYFISSEPVTDAAYAIFIYISDGCFHSNWTFFFLPVENFMQWLLLYCYIWLFWIQYYAGIRLHRVWEMVLWKHETKIATLIWMMCVGVGETGLMQCNRICEV